MHALCLLQPPAATSPRPLLFYSQEWHCDYANNEYTNKSVAYARSTDGGLTFAPAPAPDGANPAANQLLAGANTSTAHQTGEGDHGVVRVGDFLYMFALNWDGDGGSRTVPIVARSRVADGGVPGTWLKLYGGAWSEPGVGGRADAQSALPGTAAYTLPAVSPTTVLAVGVIFSASLEAAWADGTGADGAPTDFAPAAAGPLFHAGASSWDRHANSSELFGYPGLSSLEGSADGSVTPNSSFVYFKYLVPGGTFADRWLVRRPLHIVERADGGGAPPALSALSLWATTTAPAPRWWAAGGPVAPDSAPGNYSAVGALGALLTAPSTGALALYECMLAPGAVALTLDGECGAGGTLGGALLRSPGWLAPSAAAAAALGWSSVRYAGGGAAAAATPAPLWRCIGAGPANFSAATDAACAGAGPAFAPHRELGWVLVGLPAT